MEKTFLGNNLEICRILNGMWQVAGGHGQIDSELAIQDMEKYQELGFTTWDLADIYGPAESLIGDFNKKTKQNFQAFTKFVPNPGPMSNSIVTYYIEESLKKMNVDCIDLLQFHWWDYQDSSYLDALQHLSKLQNEGKIKHLGPPRRPRPHPLPGSSRAIRRRRRSGTHGRCSARTTSCCPTSARTRCGSRGTTTVTSRTPVSSRTASARWGSRCRVRSEHTLSIRIAACSPSAAMAGS